MISYYLNMVLGANYGYEVMGGIRKYVRRKEVHNQSRYRMTVFDAILILGIIFTLLGVCFGILNLLYYTGGRHEGVGFSWSRGMVETKELEPGKPTRKIAAIYYGILAISGLVMIGINYLVRKWYYKRLRKS